MESEAHCPSCGYTEADAQLLGDHHLCKNVGNAPWEKRSAPAQPAQEQTHWGDLWLCYHALKMSEWESIDHEPHDCSYCGQHREIGHHADCMIGNALKWIANQSAQPAQDDKHRAWTQYKAEEVNKLEAENERLQAALAQLLEAMKGDQHVPKLYVDMLEECISSTAPPTPPEATGFHS